MVGLAMLIACPTRSGGAEKTKAAAAVAW